MTFYDTTDLWRHGPRKFHAAWTEVHGRRVNVSTTVGRELAPQVAVPGWRTAASVPERLLAEVAAGTRTQTRTEKRWRERQAWWAQMWRSGDSPYELHDLTDEQQAARQELTTRFTPECFPHVAPAQIPVHRDALIVAETAVLKGRMLLTSNMGSLRHGPVNECLALAAADFDISEGPVVLKTDTALCAELDSPEGMKKGLKAAVLATWRKERRSGDEILEGCLTDLTHMETSTGSQFQETASRLKRALATHPAPERIAETSERRGTTVVVKLNPPTDPWASGRHDRGGSAGTAGRARHPPRRAADVGTGTGRVARPPRSGRAGDEGRTFYADRAPVRPRPGGPVHATCPRMRSPPATALDRCAGLSLSRCQRSSTRRSRLTTNPASLWTANTCPSSGSIRPESTTTRSRHGWPAPWSGQPPGRISNARGAPRTPGPTGRPRRTSPQSRPTRVDPSRPTAARPRQTG